MLGIQVHTCSNVHVYDLVLIWFFLQLLVRYHLWNKQSNTIYMFLFKPISKGDKKQRNQSLVVFPSPVFWQWGQWRKFQSNESFKKGSTLPSGSPCPQYNQDLTPLDSSCKLRSMQRKMEGTWQLKESLALTRKTSDPGENKDALWQTKKSQKAFCRHAPHWPDLEDKLETFVMELAEPWTSFKFDWKSLQWQKRWRSRISKAQYSGVSSSWKERTLPSDNAPPCPRPFQRITKRRYPHSKPKLRLD